MVSFIRRKVNKMWRLESLWPRGCPRHLEPNQHWFRPFLIGVWAIAGWPALGQEDSGAVRYELVDLLGNTRLPEVTVSVEVKKWEPDVRKGVEFLLDISNDGDEPVELYDPMDHTFIYLKNLALDASGASVSLPRDHIALHGARNNRDPEGRARAIAEIKTHGPFHFEKDDPRRRTRNVKGVEDVEGVENGLVRLEPGEHFRVRLRFTQIMGEPQKYWAAREKPTKQLPQGDRTPLTPEPIPPPRPVPISPGTYQIVVTTMLTTPGTFEPEREESTRTTINFDRPITVQLGPKPQPDE